MKTRTNKPSAVQRKGIEAILRTWSAALGDLASNLTGDKEGLKHIAAQIEGAEFLRRLIGDPTADAKRKDEIDMVKAVCGKGDRQARR